MWEILTQSYEIPEPIFFNLKEIPIRISKNAVIETKEFLKISKTLNIAHKYSSQN